MNLTRRALLRGAVGGALAVPWLESWSKLVPSASAEPSPKVPLRVLFVYAPNGFHMPQWTPEAEGELIVPQLLAPLANFRKDLLVLSGLACDGARPKGDGPGDHARAGAAFLTCAHPRKTDGADINVGTSVDQVLAKAIGDATPFPSVELGTDPSAQNGSCDSGYSCAYSSNLSWSSPSTPVAKEINPKRAFSRLFLDGEGLTPDKKAKRDRMRASVIDFVKDDAKRAKTRLSAADKKKLDEYLEAIRALEKRMGPTTKPTTRGPGMTEPPTGIPTDYAEHLKRLYDIARFAFETDTTRVMTIMCGNEGSNRSYPSIGVPEGHHDMSHHGRDAEKQSKVAKINRYHVEQLAYLLAQLKSVKVESKTLLDSTIVVYGSAIADGDAHNHDELPILVAGGSAAGLALGRHVRFKRDTPLANLYLWILQRLGVKKPQFADSTEPLSNLMR